FVFFFFQAEDGIRDFHVTGVQTCALPIFREGVPIINHARFLGYTKDRKGGNLVIEPKEAEVVKLIFNLYIGGMGPSAIADKMMRSEERRVGKECRSRWWTYH